MARHVLAKSIVCRSTRQRRLLKSTSQIVPLHPNTFKKYSIRRDKLDVEGQIETLWELSSRLPCKDMNLVEAVKGLMQTFWHDNTRPSSNMKDVFKHCRGSRNTEPHVKHYLCHMPQLCKIMLLLDSILFNVLMPKFLLTVAIFLDLSKAKNNCHLLALDLLSKNCFII